MPPHRLRLGRVETPCFSAFWLPFGCAGAVRPAMHAAALLARDSRRLAGSASPRSCTASRRSAHRARITGMRRHHRMLPPSDLNSTEDRVGIVPLGRPWGWGALALRGPFAVAETRARCRERAGSFSVPVREPVLRAGETSPAQPSARSTPMLAIWLAISWTRSMRSMSSCGQSLSSIVNASRRRLALVAQSRSGGSGRAAKKSCR